MAAGFLLFGFGALTFIGPLASSGMSQAQTNLSNGPMLALPVTLLIFCFTMDALAIGLQRSNWSGWGAFGLASGFLMTQGLIVLASESASKFVLLILIGLPWVVRKVLPERIDGPVSETSPTT